MQPSPALERRGGKTAYASGSNRNMKRNVPSFQRKRPSRAGQTGGKERTTARTGGLSKPSDGTTRTGRKSGIAHLERGIEGEKGGKGSRKTSTKKP